MKIVIALALVLSSMTASAAIFETTTNTCQNLRQAIKRNGWQYLTIKGQPKAPHFNAYYADGNDRGECAQWQQLVQAWVPTQDAKNCPVGFICQDKSVLGGALAQE